MADHEDNTIDSDKLAHEAIDESNNLDSLNEKSESKDTDTSLETPF